MSILWKLGLKKINDLKPKVLVDETKKILEILLKDNMNKEKKKQRFEQLKKLLEVIRKKVGEDERDSIALAFYEDDCMVILVENFHLLEFEARKLVSRIFVTLLSVKIEEEYLAVQAMKRDGRIIQTLFNGFNNPENAGLMSEMLINGCILHKEVVDLVLNLPNFYDLFNYLRNNNFEIATEALKVSKVLFGKHKNTTELYIKENFFRFFDSFAMCLAEDSNYMVKRQCSTLLCELLMEEEYREIMFQYINEEKYLKIIMGLLTSKAENIRYEAFHIFKLFVGNPKKKKEVYLCLKRNQSNFLTFFETFPGKEKENESTGLIEDRNYVVKKIKNLDEEYKKSLLLKQKKQQKKKNEILSKIIDNNNEGKEKEKGDEVKGNGGESKKID